MEHYLETNLTEEERKISTLDVNILPESVFIKTEPFKPTDEDFYVSQRNSFSNKEDIDNKLNQRNDFIASTISDVVKIENCAGPNTIKVNVEIGNKDHVEIKEELFDPMDVCTAQIGRSLVLIDVHNNTVRN